MFTDLITATLSPEEAEVALLECEHRSGTFLHGVSLLWRCFWKSNQDRPKPGKVKPHWPQDIPVGWVLGYGVLPLLSHHNKSLSFPFQSGGSGSSGSELSRLRPWSW